MFYSTYITSYAARCNGAFGPIRLGDPLNFYSDIKYRRVGNVQRGREAESSLNTRAHNL
jgi:hypothetical protein